MNVLIIENGYEDLMKSRLPLGRFLNESGLHVNYACPRPLDNTVYSIQMSRNQFNAFMLIDGLHTLSRIESQTCAKIVLSFRLIPNVLNYLASFKNNKVKRIAVITGLGYAFVSTNYSIYSGLQRYIITYFYRLASRRIQLVTQNHDDLKELGIINGKVILGSGVNPEINSTSRGFYSTSIKLLYVGRLLKSKGFLRAIEIFEQLLAFNPEITLTIAGTLDPENPDSISSAELNVIKAKKGINYLGYVQELDTVYSACNIFLFPSIYREGVPRVIIEALKYGLTIVTTDMPGCKETVDNNGYLMNRENSLRDVVDYLRELNEEQLLKNHYISKSLFKNEFSAKIIYPKYLELLRC